MSAVGHFAFPEVFMALHENDPCPFDGYRRDRFTEFGVTYTRCPFCGGIEPCA